MNSPEEDMAITLGKGIHECIKIIGTTEDKDPFKLH
jgi:hypothetical protein